jgi:hypothetical protein
VKGPNSWEVTRKLKGPTLLTAHWTLSEDGKTLNDAFTQYLPDGMIQPYEADGLSLKRSDEDMAKKVKLDGNDYPDLDRSGADQGAAYSGRRVNERRLEITEKSKGQVTSTRQMELSKDLNTLTVTVRLVDQNKPQSILVFERE